MAAPHKVSAFAVMCHTSIGGNFPDQSTAIRGIFDTFDHARHSMIHDFQWEMTRQHGEGYLIELLEDRNSGEVIGAGRDGRNYRLWIQLVDRTVGPQAPVAALPNANARAPKTTYIIIRHDLQENHDSRMKNHDDAKIIGQAYESLFDANQDAHTYFINKACYGGSARQRLMPGENKEEENVDSETELYRGTREVGMGDIDEIVVEVKALKIAPARRRPQQHQAPPAPPQRVQAPAQPHNRRQIPGLPHPAVPPRAPHQAPPAPPQTGRQVTGSSNRSAPSLLARVSQQAAPVPLQVAQQNVVSSKRAAPPNPSSAPASKQRRVDPSDDDDEVVCLS